MAQLYAYNYAYIDSDTNMCIEVTTTTVADAHLSDPNLVPIPVYDENYLFKYYINGAWYEDAEGTIPWESSLI